MVTVFGEWILELRARKPFNVAVVALTNKLVRIAWSVLSTKQSLEVMVKPSLQMIEKMTERSDH